ncbi:hypothetical protein J2X02_001917 [Pseudoxanthomonas japonensis]|uniref:hypothetical protein n=1 Tax=Pseudoxanthomonas japonensis TaxID=69284 RepID=UPI002862D66A|nr:hypothetical protein [Pseudoxanthomonas japonensis]MDR7069066.1 hypothetical protein [Pseudoxanthomonas japonensis]
MGSTASTPSVPQKRFGHVSKFMQASVLLASLAPLTALACSCAIGLEPRTAYSASENVAVVRVMSSRLVSEAVEGESFDAASDDESPARSITTREHVAATGRVVKQLKGRPRTNLLIETSSFGGTCSLSPQVGYTYVVFWDGASASHNNCWRQPLLHEVPDDLMRQWDRSAPPPSSSR